MSCSCIDCFYLLCTVYASVKLLFNLFFLADQYMLPKFRKPIDFKTYGKWAVITGSTDGIGKGFAKELASKGINICLISRNEEKLKNVTEEIGTGIQTKYIVADFSDSNIYNNIKEKLAELDIGILVNNVGISSDCLKPFSKQSEQLTKDFINVNIMSVTMMTSLVLPCMMKKKHGLIINISSLTSLLVLPYVAEYSASKAYMTKFGSCLSHELKKHNIRMITFTPGMVYTKLIDNFQSSIKLVNNLFPFASLTVEQFVNNALEIVNSLSIVSYGYIIYDFSMVLGKCLFTKLIMMIYDADRKNQ